MKSIAVFQRIIISSQVLSPLMESSAFVLGMKHHRRGHMLSTTAVHATSISNPNINKDEYEFDFLAAATQAAIEREDREASSSSVTTILRETTTTNAFAAPTSQVVASEPIVNEEDYEYDFIAAATQAVVERENRDAEAKAKAEESASSFKVYPAFVSPASVNQGYSKTSTSMQ